MSLSGCVYLIIGGIGAVGGYVISPDTVEGMTNAKEKEVWNSAVDVISIMGLIMEQKESGGIMIANIQGAKVTITLQTINSTTTRLRVKARRAFIPKISIAQEVFVKIMGQTSSESK